MLRKQFGERLRRALQIVLGQGDAYQSRDDTLVTDSIPTYSAGSLW
jgi:hypothetical protein